MPRKSWVLFLAAVWASCVMYLEGGGGGGGGKANIIVFDSVIESIFE